MSRSTKSKTPAATVRERLAEREGVVTARERELIEVRKRNAEHEAKQGAGALDYDALGHIEDEHKEQALVRFLEAQRPHVEVERQAVESYTLADALSDHDVQREALGVKRAATVEGIRSLLDEYAEAVTVYNGELTERIGAARRAGLIEGQADPTLPVLMGGGEYGHPRRLVIDGEHFTTLTADTDAIITEARR